MMLDSSQLALSNVYTGKDTMIMGNGISLPISHIDNLSPVPNVHLLNVLVVLCLTKILLFISKLTFDYHLSVTFTNKNFTILNCQTGRVVASSRLVGGLYVLDRGNFTFISVIKNKNLHTSYVTPLIFLPLKGD